MQDPALVHRYSTRLIQLACLLSLAGFYLAYVAADRISLGTMVGGHLMLLIGPGLLKLGYVLRLAAEEAAKPQNRRREAAIVLRAQALH